MSNSSLKTGQTQWRTAELIQSPVLNYPWLPAPHTSTPLSSSTWCERTASGAGRCRWGQVTLMRSRGRLTTRRRVEEDTETRVGIKTRGGYNQRCIIHSQWLLQLLKQWPSSYNLIRSFTRACVCACVRACVCSSTLNPFFPLNELYWICWVFLQKTGRVLRKISIMTNHLFSFSGLMIWLPPLNNHLDNRFKGEFPPVSKNLGYDFREFSNISGEKRSQEFNAAAGNHFWQLFPH